MNGSEPNSETASQPPATIANPSRIPVWMFRDPGRSRRPEFLAVAVSFQGQLPLAARGFEIAREFDPDPVRFAVTADQRIDRPPQLRQHPVHDRIAQIDAAAVNQIKLRFLLAAFRRVRALQHGAQIDAGFEFRQQFPQRFQGECAIPLRHRQTCDLVDPLLRQFPVVSQTFAQHLLFPDRGQIVEKAFPFLRRERCGRRRRCDA